MDGIEELTKDRTSQSNDVCHYTLYFPTPHASTSTSTSIESTQATTAAILEYAQELCDSVQPDGGYIWQREGFSLRPSSEKLPSSVASVAFCLQGSTTVGESVEDEWWIVWLLREISKKWKDAVIEIHDNDGQFLLIEAAEVLPSWLNPDNADNRIWIKSGDLHLIPLNASQEPEGRMSLATAITTMFDPSKSANTKAASAISNAIWSRAQDTYNAVKTEHSHRTIAYLPDEIIRILQSDPAIITKAVTTFYERDAAQLKACQYMRRFRPSPAHYATVRMSRPLYAQLASQRFYPPKPFERAGWLTVTANDDPTSAESIESRRRDTGMKLACGFEMLYQEEKSSLARQRGSSGSKVQIERGGKGGTSTSPSHLSQNQAYLKYLVALTDAGYFQGETAGSSLYAKLEARAKTYWLNMQDEKAANGENLAEKMDEITESASAQKLPLPETLQEDRDTWLYIDESRLEQMLQGKPNKAPELDGAPSLSHAPMSQDEREEKMAKEQAQRLQGMAAKFSSFLEGEGALEGAMFEDENFSEEEDDSEGEDEDMVAGPSMQAEDKEERLAKLVPGLADSEWGTAAATAARLAAKRKEDTQQATKGMQADHEDMLKSSTTSKGPSKADMESAGLTPSEKYDGDDWDDEVYEEEEVSGQQEVENKPRLLNKAAAQELEDEEDAELEFGDNERDDFLKFAREALGLTEDQYADILRSREKRGAYVPQVTSGDSPDLPHKQKSRKPEAQKLAKPDGESAPKPAASAKQQPNSRLDSFETMMAAMDAELSKARQASKPTAGTSVPRATTTTRMTLDNEQSNLSDDDEDFDFGDLDAELAEALKRDESDAAPTDYTLIKNFLESFKSQNGLAGPVSNMFGRLDKDFSLPRDG